MSYTVNKAPGNPSYTNRADGSRVYAIKYIVESSTVNDVNIHAARKAIGMPNRGDAYIHDPGAFAQEAVLEDIKQAVNKTIFAFSVDYQPMEGGGGGSLTQDEDPTKQPPKISYGNVKYQIPFIKGYKAGDVQGTPTQPVLNLCKQKYDPPAVALKINSLMTIQYNIRVFKHEWIRKYVNTINKNEITICGVVNPVLTARINELSASNSFDSNGKEYWQVSITIESSDEKFITSIAEMSYMAFNDNGDLDNLYVYADPDNNTAEIQCKSDFGNLKQLIADGLIEPIQNPHNLDADGYVAAPGAATIYTDYQQCFDIDWSPLLIPKTKGGAIRV